MLRHLKRLLLCVLLGLVTTVAVAWGCAWVKVDGSKAVRGYIHRDEQHTLAVILIERPGVKHYAYMSARRLEWEPDERDRLAKGALPVILDSPDGITVIIDARGWPVSAVWCESSEDYPAGGIDAQWLSLPTGLFRSRGVLPCRPIWSGLAIDIALFTTAWWSGLAGVGMARRWIRGHRQKCLSCGYSLSGLPAGSPCPECGPPPPERSP